MLSRNYAKLHPVIEWYVAKYMSDLRRREPRNVGVILSVDGRLSARFQGERDDGELDGRRARMVGSLDNYRDWVHYWRTFRLAADLPLVRRATDNYYLERGGQQLAGTAIDSDAFLSQLFFQLVGMREVDEFERAPDPVYQLFESLPNVDVQVDPFIEIEADVYPFDYAVESSGKLLLFRKVAFNGSERKTWDAVHAAGEAVTKVADHLKKTHAPYVIGFDKDPSGLVDRQKHALKKRIKNRFHESAGLAADRLWLASIGGTKLLGPAH